MLWALEAAWVCLIFFSCALGGWALGFVMGYRRGATDAFADKIIRADYRVQER
jgi:NhaP-type Na+/H+ or K+/H+ antiporter